MKRGWRERLRLSALLMMIAILGITGFQVYWLKNNYDREKQNLDIKTHAAFRQTILGLQASKLKLENISLRFDSTYVSRTIPPGNRAKPVKFNRALPPKEPPITVLNLIQEKMQGSLKMDSSKTVIISVGNDSLRRVFIDSLRKIGGHMRPIILGQNGDSLITVPRVIEEMHVADSENLSKKKLVTVRYGNQSKKRSLPDTLNSERSEGIFLERHLSQGGEDVFTKNHDPGQGNAVFRFLYDVDSLSQKDSVTLQEINTAYAARLKAEKIDIGFQVNRLDSMEKPPVNAVTLGFNKPTHFNLTLLNTAGYMFDKLKLPILFSLLLVGITIASFVLLYRNMRKQQKLAELKNEFISNITHELKTPIATVGVAIEALKNFNAIDDPKRTQEYLNISQNELQRLNLLVDKVLKLSMFEKKEVELKYEIVNLKEVVDEVVSSMRLQIEKCHAQVAVRNEGDTTLKADRLHLLSVVFNLLDNALKYSREAPSIQIELKEQDDHVQLIISDNGIGIPSEYHDRIFDKFFRIPHGDTHNAKGYGLGLSYAAHVTRKHKGTISVHSQPGSGTSFVINLPKQIGDAVVKR